MNLLPDKFVSVLVSPVYLLSLPKRFFGKTRVWALVLSWEHHCNVCQNRIRFHHSADISARV